jgi:rhodanese-related sulfurtransferase
MADPPEPDAQDPQQPQQLHALDPQDVKRRLDAGEIELIDVRDADEWAANHIPGARHIELPDLTARAEELDRTRPLVFQCGSGNRSQMAADAFRASGYDAYNLAGGLKAWIEAGLPVEQG